MRSRESISHAKAKLKKEKKSTGSPHKKKRPSKLEPCILSTLFCRNFFFVLFIIAGIPFIRIEVFSPGFSL